MNRIGSLCIVAAAGCALAIAACGGGSTVTGVGTSESPNASSSPVGLSRCMRAHGVTNFPDPTAESGGVGFNGLGVSNTGVLVVDGTTFSGPVAQKAEKACRRFLPPGGAPPPPTAAQKQRALRFAECMRTHGVPNFQDPSFKPGAGSVRGQTPVDTQSPAFQHAVKACGFNGRLRITG